MDTKAKSWVLCTVLLLMMGVEVHAKTCAEVFSLWERLHDSGHVLELLDTTIPTSTGQHQVKRGGGIDGYAKCDVFGELVDLTIIPVQSSQDSKESLANLINTTRALWVLLSDQQPEFEFKDKFLSRLTELEEKKKAAEQYPYSATSIRETTGKYAFTVGLGYLNKQWMGWHVLIRR